MNLDKVKAADIEVANYIEEELKRQQTTIELIASENFTSPAVMQKENLTNVTTTAVKLLIRLKSLLKKEPANSFTWITQMFSPTPVLRQIWLFLQHF